MNLKYCDIAPQAWDRMSIDDVCLRVTSGGTPSRKRSDFYGGDILWVKTKELLDGWIEDSEERITQAGLDGSSAKLLKPNAVLMAMYGATVGQLGILRTEATCNQAACVMEVDPEKANFRFLFYMLRLHREQIISMASGAAQQNLSGALIKSFFLPFPSPSEQARIAGIIADIDDKIDVNSDISGALEETAQAIYKSWFVDFDPVKAKFAAVRFGKDPELAAMATLSGKLSVPAGKPKPEGIEEMLPSAEAIDEAISQLDSLSNEQKAKLAENAAEFPEDFVESEIGLIPNGWDVKPFTSICKLNEQSWTKRNSPTQVEYVDLANTKFGEILSTERYDWKDAPSRARRVLRNGDTIVGTVRPANRSFAYVDDDRQLTGSTGFAVLTPSEDIYRELVYLHATSDDNIQRLGKLADGAAYPAVRPDVVIDFSIALPSDETLIKNFHELTAQNFDLIVSNRKESNSLGEMRDLLLPKLMSGEIELEMKGDQ